MPSSRPRAPARRLRTVSEVSAGGLVVDRAGPEPRGALIGRFDRRGRLLWSLPKGHLEAGETAQDAAVREVEEETGIRGQVLSKLGVIDFWFVAGGQRVHKTVHHFLLEATAGELSDSDVEVDEVAWVPLAELAARLAYETERKLVLTLPEPFDAAGEAESAAVDPIPTGDPTGGTVRVDGRRATSRGPARSGRPRSSEP